jgi:hypothetical protein
MHQTVFAFLSPLAQRRNLFLSQTCAQTKPKEQMRLDLCSEEKGKDMAWILSPLE